MEAIKATFARKNWFSQRNAYDYDNRKFTNAVLAPLAGHVRSAPFPLLIGDIVTVQGRI